MICKHILLKTLLNEPKSIILDTVTWFQVFQTDFSIYY